MTYMYDDVLYGSYRFYHNVHFLNIVFEQFAHFFLSMFILFVFSVPLHNEDHVSIFIKAIPIICRS